MASRNEPKGKLEQGTDPIELPGVFGILPLRNSVLFPQTVMPISVGGEKTMRMIDDAIREKHDFIFINKQVDMRNRYRHGLREVMIPAAVEPAEPKK